jgi:hypothetical protein
VERSPLKSLACLNTAPHNNQEKSKDKNGLKKKRRREHCSKIKLVLPQKKKKGKRNSQKRFDLGERKKRVYVLPFMVVTFPTSHAEMFALKVLLLEKTYDMSVTKEMSQSAIGP